MYNETLPGSSTEEAPDQGNTANSGNEKFLTELSKIPEYLHLDEGQTRVYALSGAELRRLEGTVKELGFNTHVIMSRRHGAKKTWVHGNINYLTRRLAGENPEPYSLQSELASLRENGRLHIRIYEDRDTDDVSYIVAHVDPPDTGHLNLANHARNEIRTDCIRGENIMEKVLKHAKVNCTTLETGNQSE